MAEEQEISVPQLKNMMRTPEFQDRHNEYFMELGKDPRVRLTQAKIVELLPKAFMSMKKGLEDPDAPWTDKVKIVEKILELSGIERPQTLQNDRKEFEQFWEEEAGEDDRIRKPYPPGMRRHARLIRRGSLSWMGVERISWTARLGTWVPMPDKKFKIRYQQKAVAIIFFERRRIKSLILCHQYRTAFRKSGYYIRNTC
jgi:hypothetical protein